jgi:hypothetical protein
MTDIESTSFRNYRHWRSLADCDNPFKNAKFTRLIDKDRWGDKNGFMRNLLTLLVIGHLAGAAILGILVGAATAGSTLYYCPDRKMDQQYSATQGPGCVPLVEKQMPGRDESNSDKPQREFRIDNLQQDVSAFLDRYRRFLDCCKTDLNELYNVERLGDEVHQLLTSTQANLPNYSLASRGIMLRELIPRVAKARGDLKILRARLEKMNEMINRRNTLGFEEAGRESQRIRDLEESIERDIVAPKLPRSAKSGPDIGVAPAAGPSIGRSSKTGADIGREGSTGQEIGVSPKNSRDIGGSGPSGFEIGATGRAGPGIGDSSVNDETSSSVNSTLQQSTVGSSIPDSTVGSSINSSTIGSSMQDSSVGSSFGGSSVGSSLQNR